MHDTADDKFISSIIWFFGLFGFFGYALTWIFLSERILQISNIPAVVLLFPEWFLKNIISYVRISSSKEERVGPFLFLFYLIFAFPLNKESWFSIFAVPAQ